MNDKLKELLDRYPEFEKLAEETEELRCIVDELFKKDVYKAFALMMQVDIKMMQLNDYHMQLSTACLNKDE